MWLLTGLTVTGVFLFFVTVQRAELSSYDGKMMVSVAYNIVQHGSLETTGDFFGFNTPYSTYGIGTSLLLVPFAALQHWIRPDGAQLHTLANPVVLAVTAGVVLHVGAELGWRRWVSAVSGIAFALLTMALWQSTEVLSEPGVTFGVALGLLGLAKLSNGRAAGFALIGFGVGAAILFRTDSIVLVGVMVLFVPLAVPIRRLVQPLSLIALLGPVAAALSWVAYYNWLRYGSVLEFGYQGYGFTTPLGEGLRILLVDPGSGFFYYDPLLLAAIPGLWWLAQRNRVLTVAVVALCVLRTVFFARWQFPYGGVSWGPRFIAPLCVVLAVPFGECLERVASAAMWRRKAGFAAFGMLAAMASVVNLASVWVAYENGWIIATRPAAVNEDPALIQARFTSYLESFSDGHIMANIRMLDDGEAFPLRHWRGGPQLIGVLSLGGALIALVASTTLAVADDRGARRRTRPSASSSSRVLATADG